MMVQDVWKTALVIALGAALGALLRWQLGLRLNSLFPTLPLGTLAANVIGGYLIGLALGYFLIAHDISPAWKFFIITGFCGGLTTFSTFSAEVVHLLQAGRHAWAVATVGVHVAGSLLATLAGLASWNWVKGGG